MEGNTKSGARRKSDKQRRAINANPTRITPRLNSIRQRSRSIDQPSARQTSQSTCEQAMYLARDVTGYTSCAQVAGLWWLGKNNGGLWVLCRDNDLRQEFHQQSLGVRCDVTGYLWTNAHRTGTAAQCPPQRRKWSHVRISGL